MNISDDVKEVLQVSRIEGKRLYLPNYQLDRDLYVSVNKVLAGIGGKWNRKAKAHLFDHDPQEEITRIIEEGKYTVKKQEYQFFETPQALALSLVELAGIQPGERVLEPSAGRGAIADMIPRHASVDCIELEESNRRYLLENGYHVVGEDFLQFDQPYDVIIANPPFSNQQDIDHILHMIDLAERRVVSVASAGITFRKDKKAGYFREIVTLLNGAIIPLPEGTFKASGTNVNACIVVI